MPDWQQIVETRLRSLRLPGGRAPEIVTELADHLADEYEHWLRRGASPEEAYVQTLKEAPDWELLRRRLERAQAEEIPMNERVKRFWLPGSVALMVSLLLLSLQRFVFPASAGYWFPVPREKTLVFCLPWLMLLPAVGALAAFVCRRAGGGAREQIVVSLFPALAYAGLFAAILPGALILDHIYRNVGPAQMLTGFAASVVSWVIAPGIALFCGALPFLAKGHSNSGSAAIS